METYEVTAPFVQIGSNVKVQLKKSQVKRRLHNLRTVDNKSMIGVKDDKIQDLEWYVTSAKIQFKKGETFGLEEPLVKAELVKTNSKPKSEKVSKPDKEKKPFWTEKPQSPEKEGEAIVPKSPEKVKGKK